MRKRNYRSPHSIPRVLLIGPYDPHCGEYTFLAPPLGVWRLQGYLSDRGIPTEVFDPNLCVGDASEALRQLLLTEGPWSIVGVSTTGMTLVYDLELAHVARRLQPGAVLVAGGMEATFEPELMFELAPFDLVVLGEGEKPLVELARRLRRRERLDGITGTAYPDPSGRCVRRPQVALDPDELEEAIFATPYDRMPYRDYWDRLEGVFRVGELPEQAAREARLAETRSVRLNTLNYCPMGCTFCSSTNFLHEAQGSNARIRRLDADGCMTMLERIVREQPDVRTVIFQDDIFVFTQDDRILPLCGRILEAKSDGRLPRDLQFISTNRIDAMTPERLAAMREAGFRVLGFGVESFSRQVLAEFNKAKIYPHVEPMLQEALRLGVTPFLDLILTSPRCELGDFAETVRQAYRWLLAGCEIGMYPYVIPFSGAAMARDPALKAQTIDEPRQIAGTDVSWPQPAKILPLDRTVREAILEVEAAAERWLGTLGGFTPHLPSRLRSLVWILSAAPVLRRAGEEAPEPAEVFEQLMARLDALTPRQAAQLRTLWSDGALSAPPPLLREAAV